MNAVRAVNKAAAYAYCRAVAKREAKNFYYAFRVLPRRKSDAMCAVYAFMRKADDLADDETLSLEQRRRAMAEWTAAWRASRMEASDDPLFVALADTQQRFQITDDLLEQLVAGTTMDLQPESAGADELLLHVGSLGQNSASFQVYRNFTDLYQYCYLVASVVGLVCIRIFGYTDPRAELLAEHTGIAFQLTNILRDIKEDAERGRMYLPLDDMKESGVEPLDIVSASRTGSPQRQLSKLLQQIIARADAYYRAADELIPMLDTDARPAMGVLVRIYHELLARIAVDPSAVFRTRVSVPTHRKLSILAGGLLRSVIARSRS